MEEVLEERVKTNERLSLGDGLYLMHVRDGIGIVVDENNNFVKIPEFYPTSTYSNYG